MQWEVLLHEEVDKWLLDLTQSDPHTADEVAAAIDKLAEDGPTLGRPLADRIHGSRHHHMKELRPRTNGSGEIRMLFAFDPDRQALILVAGDKQGAWSSWYTTNIPIADDRYDEHLDSLKEPKP
ncbi:type II toxin-antitoxin system RelE/ParE family toxin [Streptomyces sp. NPDC051976]|uniref:type II toxin-antitoxin system RelE/ParE family toxin n=1 Tax=Streptomyces sp. NPDC051976 TaxID=3154947 RepID=UPI003419C69D